ncbi:acetyl-CoA synthetase-like protein [Meredithblackwellia eburnea MCA 4105]
MHHREPTSYKTPPSHKLTSPSPLLSPFKKTNYEKQQDTFIFGVPDKQLNMQRYTFGQIHLSASLLAKHYSAFLPQRKKGDKATKMTVALLAPSNYDYVVNEQALCRMGLSTLFISINNSPAAIARLLEETGSTHLVLHPTYAKVAAEGIDLMPEDKKVTVVPIADPEVYGARARKENPTLEWDYPLSWEDEADTLCFILHSSGSTGFPKPIYVTHHATIANSVLNFGMSGFTTLPMYHNGGHAMLYRGIYAIKPTWIFPASDLPLTPSNVLNLLSKCEPEALFAVPYIYKLLAESEEGIARLNKFKLCIYGGSHMPDDLGDFLVEKGVPLAGNYGSTETGGTMSSMRDFATDKEWAYNRVTPAFAPYCLLEERDAGVFELIVKDGWPGKIIKNRPDGSYSTSDLFIKHATRPNLLRFVGRLDDTLVLVNGEKVNPVPIEMSLKVNPNVSEAIVFGAGRSQTGVLIVLAESVDPSASRSTLLELFAPILAAANEAAPSHAEVMQEMVVFLPYGTLIPKADKASFIRKKVYAAFKEDIDAAYERLEGNDGLDDSERATVGNVSEMEQHLLKLVAKVAGSAEGLELDTDLFSSIGLDSLQAGRIRNFLQREYNFGGRKLSTNMVFEHPTIKQLAEYVVATAEGKEVKVLSPSEQMLAFVEKYRHFEVPKSALSPKPRTTGAVVVLTGATGSLGAQTLAALLADPKTVRVYNLVRASNDDDAVKRVERSLKERGLPGAGDPRVVSLASDFSQDCLGLTQSRYEEIEQSVTLVLHNAWSVNFNLNITSFEPHIVGCVNFIKMCLNSPYVADFYFASSVSSVAAWGGPGPVPEAVMKDTASAQGMGYAQSKWVAEKLCEIASETTPCRAVVLRIGQMVGSSLDGKWNETEAVSLQIKSAQTIGALPNLADNVSWLAVDHAAAIILELAALPAPAPGTSQTWHIVQPRTVPWADVLSSLRASELKFDVLEPKEWLERLRKGPQDPLKNPTIKLLSFFESKYDAPATTGKAPFRWPLDTSKTAAASSAFRNAPIADDILVGKFVESWRKTGFLQ